MVSQNTKLEQEKEQSRDKAFLEEYKALVEPLNEKHGRRLMPILSSDRNSIQAVFGIDRFKKEIINVEKAKKPETDKQSDTDTKAS
jgi:hypothetical protein